MKIPKSHIKTLALSEIWHSEKYHEQYEVECYKDKVTIFRNNPCSGELPLAADILLNEFNDFGQLNERIQEAVADVNKQYSDEDNKEYSSRKYENFTLEGLMTA
jgi:hypothetical protein